MSAKNQHRRHAPFYFAVLCALIVFPVALWLHTGLAIQAAANSFFLVYLVLSGIMIRELKPAVLREHAAGADQPVWIIFAVTFVAVLVAVASLFLVLNGGQLDGINLTLSLASVALGWLTIHTMAAFHYAHLFWQPDTATGPAPAGRGSPRGGLEFPATKEPEGYDFLYFSFVIGMTAQTSDVQITSTSLRKLNLLHAVVSFFFNTVLVAAAVNVAVSLGS